MKIGNRSIGKMIAALVQFRHYRALWNMMLLSDNFVSIFNRYFLGAGSYPFTVNLKTPTGMIAINTYSHHDILTVNEIFFRKDYFIPNERSIKTIVDIGANIGVSALYFLTRNANSIVYLIEPDPRNQEKLLLNTKPFANRIVLEKKAVSDYTGVVEFAIEESGRYGGIGRNFESKISVECVNINDLLRQVITAVKGNVDILKIDTEGLELTIMNAIENDHLNRLETIFYEKDHATKDEKLAAGITSHFNIKKYGPIRVLTNRFGKGQYT
jgi:FkbM family methyltransferase